MSKPKNTPWGLANEVTEITVGIYFVSTPSHGGMAIILSRAFYYLSPACIKRHDGLIGDFYFFEEDIKCVIPMYELQILWQHFYPNLGMSAINEKFLKSLSRNFPNYLFEKGITPSAKEYQKYLIDQEEEQLRQEKSDRLIVSAYEVPTDASLVRVCTAASNHYLVTRTSYRLSSPHFLENCEVVKFLGNLT